MLNQAPPALNRVAFDQLAEQPPLRQIVAERGYVYVDGIPPDFDHAAYLAEHVGALMPQYDGQTVWSIKAEERFEGVYHSLNTQPLSPHTECYELDAVPPRYLALWCLVPGPDGEGQTTLADGLAFVDTLSEEERHEIANRRFDFLSTAGLQEMRLGSTARHPILELREERPPILRFTCRCIRDEGRDPFLDDLRRRLLDFFDDTHVAISFEPRALLVWDNHRMLHSRTGYSDPRRHLRRVWLAENLDTDRRFS